MVINIKLRWWCLITIFSLTVIAATTAAAAEGTEFDKVIDCNNLKNVRDPCRVIKESCPDTTDLVDFQKLYYCQLRGNAVGMGVVSFMIILACFYTLYYLSENHLSIPLQRLILAINMDSQVAGVTLLSLANGAPDFFTALAGASQDSGSELGPGSGLPLVIGSLLGSGVFTTGLAMGISILLAKPSKEPSEIKEPLVNLPLDNEEPNSTLRLSRLRHRIRSSLRTTFQDRSWIVLPRGYFVNLLVYNLGLGLLLLMCITHKVNLLYPVLQYLLYLAYIIYTLLPKFHNLWRKFCWKYGFLKRAHSTTHSHSPSLLGGVIPEVPTVIVTCPDRESHLTNSTPHASSENQTGLVDLMDAEVWGLPTPYNIVSTSNTTHHPTNPSPIPHLSLPPPTTSPNNSSWEKTPNNNEGKGNLELSPPTIFNEKTPPPEPVVPQLMLPGSPEPSVTAELNKEILPVASDEGSLAVPSGSSTKLRRPPPPLPRLSISLSPASAAPLPLSQQMVHRTFPTFPFELGTSASFDPTPILIHYGFQDPPTAGFFHVLTPCLTGFTRKSEAGWVTRGINLATLPIKALLLSSMVPTFEVWTQIDRGEEDWEPNEFFYREPNALHQSIHIQTTTESRLYGRRLFGLLPSNWYLCCFSHPRTLTSHRIFMFRQLVALSPTSLRNFRQFSAVTFLVLGFLATLINGVAFQSLWGIPGCIVGLVAGALVGAGHYGLTYPLCDLVRQYRNGLAKFLVRNVLPDSNAHLSPFNLDEVFYSHGDSPDGQPPPEPFLLQVPSGDGGLRPDATSEGGNRISPIPSFHGPCPPPPPSPLLKRMPSWSATFDALGRRSHSSGGSFRRSPSVSFQADSPSKSASSISIAPNYRLQAFLRMRPELDLRVLDLVTAYNLLLLVFGVVTSVVYINAVSGLLVTLLTNLAQLLSLPSLLVGMTVLAWGNSISDLVSAVGMARGGHPKIALTSTLAGPIFNLLLTFGTSLTDLLATSPVPSLLLPPLPPITYVALAFLASNALLILLGAGPFRRPLLTYLPLLQITNFSLFLLTVILVQSLMGSS